MRIARKYRAVKFEFLQEALYSSLANHTLWVIARSNGCLLSR
ncbi:hypothetical protein BAZSYMB_GCONTIG00637_0 [Bathymodiolus azoricus thioautotrophic gill symbiont]|uniref:Uncharacterized protein n=1 Tax=Bathymodiolus azoricus thioautotrophic gill symbiont TaxID=235205 RepID=A0A1H6K6C0_9GAMM|nr:hypothetical protein BAZSYMB_GCONTIG00637_0 [Bathymodiolus azoricus thioautotrophic gill symbiont]